MCKSTGFKRPNEVSDPSRLDPQKEVVFFRILELKEAFTIVCNSVISSSL